MRALMTGGGTGGHVNPAIAIANTIKEHEKDSVIAFVGTERGIENKLVPKHGYEVYHVEIQGLKRSLSLSNVRTAYLMFTSVRKAKKIIKEFRPDVVVGTGGYVCWPLVKAASLLGVPTVLHESNALPGKAVQRLKKYVDVIYTNFEVTKTLLNCGDKAVRVGNPLVSGFEALSKEEARKKIGADGKYRKILLSFGGSLGARTLNLNALEIMDKYVRDHKEVLYIHSTGSRDYPMMKEEFEKRGLNGCPNIELCEYIYDMPYKMAAADLVICRAGAMTLSEVAMLGKPSILIPSPNVTDNHQYKNARELELVGAAAVFEEKDLEKDTVADKVAELFSSPEKLASMGENVKQFAVKDAGETIYKGIRELVKNKKPAHEG